MKKIKVIPAYILIAAILFLVPSVYVQGAGRPTSEFYVNDFAGILSNDTRQYIVTQSKRLEEQSKAQVVVVTVDGLSGKTIEDYATEMFRSYGIGDKTQNSGILILLALQEREIRIEVGYGLEGAINDAKAGRIIRNLATPLLKENKWDAGVKTMYTAVLKEVYAEYHLEEPSTLDQTNIREGYAEENYGESSSGGSAVSSILVIVMLILFFLFGGGGRGRRGGRFYGGGMYGGGHFGGGGFGGGSFGGGGSSGGGGASGKF